jgi:hypothetical protein
VCRVQKTFVRNRVRKYNLTSQFFLSGYSTEKEEGGDQFLSIADTTGALRYLSKSYKVQKDTCMQLND